MRPESPYPRPISVAVPQRTNIVPVAMDMTENTFTQMEALRPWGCTPTQLTTRAVHKLHVQMRMCNPCARAAINACSGIFFIFFFCYPPPPYFNKLSIDSPSLWGWRWRASRRVQAAPCCCPPVLGMAWSKICQSRRSPGCALGRCPCTQSSTPTEQSLPWWPAGNKTYWFQL